MRILVIAHLSSEQTRGGTELFTERLVTALRAEDVECLSLARDLRPEPNGSRPFRSSGHRDNLLWSIEPCEHLEQRQRSRSVRSQFRRLLRAFRPDAVHFQHYAGLGLDLVVECKKAMPEVPIVLTLHELHLICHADGHMYRLHDERPCRASSPMACHQCFPEIEPGRFLARERFLKGCLHHVDQVLTPSRFVASRIREWGVDPSRVRVVDNGQPSSLAPLPFESDAEQTFGFFGHVHPKKGLHVLLQAAEILLEDGFEQWSMEVNSDSTFAGSDYRAEIDRALDELSPWVRRNGRYEPDGLSARMRRVGWVVVPSIWWENRPLVIQEAFCCDRPVICSDIGGMAEAVPDRQGGLQFRAGDPYDLARVLRNAASRPELWGEMRRTIPAVPAIEAVAREHLDLYERLISAPRSVRLQVVPCGP